MILGLTISTPVHFLILVGAIALLAVMFVKQLVNSPFGRVLKAIREDEVFAQSLGKNVTRYKLSAFLIGGALAGVAGVLYAHYVSFIDPTSFTVGESIFMLTIVIVGGTGSITGSVVGAALLVIIPEALRFLGVPSTIAANLRQILYGALLVVCMMFRPQGILGEFTLTERSQST